MGITAASLIKESQDRYLTYALSVVSGRALPDVRDGLKPVQRRILYAMLHNLGLKPSSSHRKSAAVVGEVLARFHPHGDVACYEAMVRMAQDFSLRYPLVDGQGNFGSLDGDSAAAYRYTEAKLTKIALEVIGEIGEETVAFRENFDSTTTEPVVLPSRVPNLLVNGATGIAVGMATSIPPHNLGEVARALIELSKDPSLSVAKITSYIKGPDFPTGCQILNTKKEFTDLYKSGRGAIRMRGEWKVEDQGRGKKAIIISSIPYAVNKAVLVEKIAGLIIGKKLPQLVDVRDESTDIVRVVLELASGAEPEVAAAYLYKHTPLESNFQVNLTALIPSGGETCRPQLLSLKECLSYFLEFRTDVTRKRLAYEKRQLEERIHILEGLVKIFDHLDEAIKIVRQSTGRSDSAEKIRKRFKLSEIQSFAIVDMRIYQLSKTNITEIRAELKDKKKRVAEIEALLKSKAKIAGLVRKDLENLVNDFGDKRRSKIVQSVDEFEFNEADYVVEEEVFAIITRDGWVKRIRQTNALETTRIREGDEILNAHAVSTLESVAVISSMGYLYVVKSADFPSSSGYGDPIQKLLKFRDGESVVSSFVVRPIKERADDSLSENELILLVSKTGTGFVAKIPSLEGVKRNGKRIMKLRAGDALAAIDRLNKNCALFTKNGSGLVIQTKDLPTRDSASIGVSLIGVRSDDQLIGVACFSTKCVIRVVRDSGKELDLPSNKITKGKRGLKGTKVVSRGRLSSIEGVVNG